MRIRSYVWNVLNLGVLLIGVLIFLDDRAELPPRGEDLAPR